MDFFMSLVMFNTFYYLLFFPPGCIFSCVLSFFSFPILFLCFFTHFHFHLWTLDPIWTMISTLTSLWPLWWPTFISGKTSGNCVPSVTATHRLASAFIHDSEASTHTGGTFWHSRVCHFRLNMGSLLFFEELTGEYPKHASVPPHLECVWTDCGQGV